MFDHDKVLVRHPQFVEPVPVDKDIAALLRALWNLGINTDDSCQNIEPGFVWIQFTTGKDAGKFLNAVAAIRDLEGPEAADRLYFRILNGEGGWGYEIAPWDDNLVLDLDDRTGEFLGPAEMVLPVGVKFPITDYFRVLHLVNLRQNLPGIIRED